MLKFVMMPPQDELQRQWARRFAAEEPLLNVVNKAAWY